MCIRDRYDISGGSIYVSGRNIAHLSLTELRRSMSIIPQFGFLFESTLRDNLDPSQRKSDDQIRDLIDRSGFKIRGVNLQEKESKPEINGRKGDAMIEVESPKTNISFAIEKSGKNLSNGEKQIINFLRILLRDATIICLDEATSNMDPQTDHALHRALFEYTKDKTMIVITHRLENIKEYDRVIVMDQGQIVEQGSYEQLKFNPSGFFGRMARKNPSGNQSSPTQSFQICI
eukprot:TRINITY_DN1896_c0_g1_i9.p1 TRINITY_DN1896_c0_g1~~TRINITY_DN1896_c0_g1_i9.p1  ORF type:complete len:232 (-),score=41.79 TRINITY_DN1896_c0_g1_i9:131-826(-)